MPSGSLPIPYLGANGGANSDKSERSGGGGILTYFFNVKAYPTDFMQFFFKIFAEFWDLGGTSRSPPFPPVVQLLLLSNQDQLN